jgi:uncharacterized protein YdaU (DUF1376 family)
MVYSVWVVCFCYEAMEKVRQKRITEERKAKREAEASSKKRKRQKTDDDDY